MKVKTKFILQFLISICLIILLLRIVSPGQVIGLLKNIRPWHFLLLLLVITLDRIFMAYKWHLLLKARGVKVSINDTIRIYYVGTFASFFLPATVGADLVRIYKLHSEKKDGAKIFSSVVLERMLGFIASALVACIGILFLIYILKLDLWRFFWISAALFILFILFLFVSFNSHYIFVRRRKGVIYERLEGIYRAYLDYKGHKALLILFVVLSALEQLVPVIANHIAAHAIGLYVPVLYFLAIIPIVQLFTKIPVSFNGIGINEGLLVYFFGILGLQGSNAFTIGLVGHAAILISVLPVVFWLTGRRFLRGIVSYEKK